MLEDSPASDLAAQRGQETAAAALEHAALQFVMTRARMARGDATEEQIRGPCFALERAALRYAAAFGWGPRAGS